jgi:hypothetical protein
MFDFEQLIQYPLKLLVNTLISNIINTIDEVQTGEELCAGRNSLGSVVSRAGIRFQHPSSKAFRSL